MQSLWEEFQNPKCCDRSPEVYPQEVSPTDTNIVKLFYVQLQPYNTSYINKLLLKLTRTNFLVSLGSLER